MKALNRFATSIAASFDWMISQVENHEALVSSAIQEAQEAAARARARLSRVKADGQAMRKRLVELRLEQELWQERALKTAASDEKKAIECLKRRKRLEKQIADTETNERQHAAVERQLSQDLVVIDERLNQLRQQRNVMRTRQSRAEALKAVRNSDSSALNEIDEIFERWEARVSECEMAGSAGSASHDELDEEFVTEEEQQELKNALQELVSQAAAQSKA